MGPIWKSLYFFVNFLSVGYMKDKFHSYVFILIAQLFKISTREKKNSGFFCSKQKFPEFFRIRDL